MEKDCPIRDRKASFTGIKLGSYQIYLYPDCSLRSAPTAFELKVNYSDIDETSEYANQIKEIQRIAHPAKWGNMATDRPFFKNVKHRDGVSTGCGIVRAGVIRSDSFPPTPVGPARWLTRRVRPAQLVPLGRWLHLAR